MIVVSGFWRLNAIRLEIIVNPQKTKDCSTSPLPKLQISNLVEASERQLQGAIPLDQSMSVLSGFFGVCNRLPRLWGSSGEGSVTSNDRWHFPVTQQGTVWIFRRPCSAASTNAKVYRYPPKRLNRVGSRKKGNML